MKEIMALEKAGWEALSGEGQARKEFYASVLRDDTVMLFPGGMRIEGKDQILESIGSQPWTSYEIQKPALIDIVDEVKTIIYRVSARREGSPLYEALIASTYVRSDGTWKMVLHQQSQS